VKRTIIKIPDPILWKKAEPVGSILAYHHELAAEMLSLVSSHLAIGIAAPQIGESVRMIYVKWGMEWILLINPEIVKDSPEQFVAFESCLSLPDGSKYEVARPKITKVRGMELDGRFRALKGRDLGSSLLCHEIDHLNGVLINMIGLHVRGEQ